MRRAAGFTLIEILAVVAIFALMAAFVAPNLGVVSRRALQNEAEGLAARLELARQRSVVTATPHRLVLDIDAGSFQLQWLSAGDAEPEEAIPDAAGDAPLSLEAPAAAELAYAPLPGPLGRLTALDDDVLFEGVETPEGWIDRGQAFVVFERDGSAAYTLITLGNEDGDTLELEVLPLADAVRILDEAE